MGIEDIEHLVLTLVSKHANVPASTLTVDTVLDTLGIDSLKANTIVYDVEDRLGIEVANDAIENVKTVGDVVAAIEAAVSEGA